MDDICETFRLNIKHYREEKGWSQSELAIQANSSNGQIGNIESGKSKPSFSNIISISKALGIHPADLFLRDASKQSDREIFSSFINTIKDLNDIPEKSRKPIEQMIKEMADQFRLEK